MNFKDDSTQIKDKTSNKLHGDRSTAQWDCTADNSNDSSNDNSNQPVTCDAPKWKDGNTCVDVCPVYGNLISSERICVTECPRGSVIDKQEKTCILMDKNYDARTPYEPGDIVIIGDRIYRCKPAPEGWWCKQNAYQPDAMFGNLAWDDITDERYVPVPLLPPLKGEYKPNTAYAAGDIVEIRQNPVKYYKCRAWPFTANCAVETYRPDGIYGASAWTEIDASQVNQTQSKVTTETTTVSSNNGITSKNTNTTIKEIPAWCYTIILVLAIAVIALALGFILQMNTFKKYLSNASNPPKKLEQIFTDANIVTETKLKD